MGRAPAFRGFGAKLRRRCGRSPPRLAMITVAGLALAPSLARAHDGGGLPGGFQSGFAHPLSGLDHLLAMVCVGLWGAFLGRPLIYLLPTIFPAVVVCGAVLAMIGLPFPPTEIGAALSVIVLGGCIGLAMDAPVWAASLVVAAFGLCHGYAHGRELPSATDPVAYSAGFVLATGLLHLLGIGLGGLNRHPVGVVVNRAIGGLVALAGVWFLTKAIVP